MNQVMDKYGRFIKARDNQLIGIIEAIEGRVPSDQEMSKHGFHGIFPDGHSEWKWKGSTILIEAKFNPFL